MTRIFKPDSGQTLEIQDEGGSAALTIDTSGNAEFSVSVKTDTISEKTATTGVTIDGTLIKDNAIKPASGQSLVLQEDGGSAALTIDTDGNTEIAENIEQSDGKNIQTDEVRARDGDGLKLYDDAGTAGIFVEDGGEVGIGTASPTALLHVSRNGGYICLLENTYSGVGAGSRVLNLYFSTDHNAEDEIFLNCADIVETKCNIYSNGSIYNQTGVYGNWSDERIKSEITDANTQWDDIKAVRVRNYKKNSDVSQYGNSAKKQLGVIAQELELISPHLISEVSPTDYDIKYNDFGEQDEFGEWKVKTDANGDDVKVKTIKTSILQMKAFKALQEAMAKIEILEAENTAMKTRMDALEAKVEALENA